MDTTGQKEQASDSETAKQHDAMARVTLQQCRKVITDTHDALQNSHALLSRTEILSSQVTAQDLRELRTACAGLRCPRVRIDALTNTGCSGCH